MPIQLPTAPRQIERKGFPWRSTWIIGSPPKVGKSKFVEGLWKSTGKRILHIDLENSTEDLSGYIVTPRSLSELREIVAQLRANPEAYDAVAIDTFDILNAWCEEETCAELHQKAMGEAEGYGKDWAMARGKALDIVRSLQMTGRLILLIVHTKVEKGNFSGVNIAVPQGLSIAVRGYAQVIGYLYAFESSGEVKRAISFAPSDNTIAGSRYAELNNRTILLPLMDREKDGKGWVNWQGIFLLFGEGQQAKEAVK